MTFEKVAIFSRLPSNAVVEMLSVKDSDRIFIENKGDVNVVSKNPAGLICRSQVAGYRSVFHQYRKYPKCS